MTGVLYHQPHISLFGKFDAGYNIVCVAYADRVAGVIPQLAWSRWVSERVAGLVLEIGVHDLCGVQDTKTILVPIGGNTLL